MPVAPAALKLTREIARDPQYRMPVRLVFLDEFQEYFDLGDISKEVASWAGHSIAVLLKIYAKCLYGEQEAAFRRIESFRQAYATPEAA